MLLSNCATAMSDEPLLLCKFFPFRRKMVTIIFCRDAVMRHGWWKGWVVFLCCAWLCHGGGRSWSFGVVFMRVFARRTLSRTICTINHISNFENLVVSCVITIITKRTLDFCMCKAKIQRRSGCRVVTMGEWGMSCFRLC